MRMQSVAADLLAGLVGSVVLIANIVSFAALMFPGPLAAGAATAIWALLIGSGVIGIWVAWRTSLPPLATGIDSPTGTVLVLLALSAGQALQAAGTQPGQTIAVVMLLFSAATALSGALLLTVGLAGWSGYLRFVPAFVIGGFLAATGWLLVAGGIRLTTHRPLAELLLVPPSGAEAAKLACAAAVLALLLALKRWVRWPFALPVALIVLSIGGSLALQALGFAGPEHGWYLPALGAITAWQPLAALQAPTSGVAALPWPLIAAYLPDMVAVAIVALISLVTKTATLEATRKVAGDLDVERRAHGWSTRAAVPLGGIAASLQLGTSRLLESAGASTRRSGIVCALVLLLVGMLHFDLPALIPLPIAAGLVFQLGWSFFSEALAKPIARRDWPTVAAALAIMAVCVRYGYLPGVIGGVVAACFLFAVSYARIGTVRQHLSRAQFAGNVLRSTEATRLLGERGEAIQIYWLAGYVFFGSSEGVVERVRRDVRARPARTVRHVILDFGLVTAADASMTVSLAKLQSFCREQGARRVFASLAPRLQHLLERDGLLAPGGAAAQYTDVSTALAAAEEAVLAEAAADGHAAGAAPDARFEAWLQQQLGPQVRGADFLAYLQRREVEDGQVLYRAGDPADQIDLVAEGHLLVDLPGADGRPLRVRNLSTRTVVGEMGFFRQATRTATVASAGPSTLWTLTRAEFARMQRERPEVANAFYEFLVRTLADRIVLSEKLLMAVSR